MTDTTTKGAPCLPEEYRDRIVCGDSLTVMRRLPAECVDVVVTSPPYNMRAGTGTRATTGHWPRRALAAGYDGHDDRMSPRDYIAWQRACLTEMLRLVADGGAVFYNHKWRIQRGILDDRHPIVDGFPVRQIIIWTRPGGINFNPAFFLPTFEVIYLIATPSFRLTPGANKAGDVWTISPDRRNRHPAPFPLELATRIIGATTASTVLDPFAGSGTTALAARQLGRHFLGIDQSAAYCQMARQRLATLDEPNETSECQPVNDERRGAVGGPFGVPVGGAVASSLHNSPPSSTPVFGPAATGTLSSTPSGVR
jgi:modification methylase